MTETPPKIFKKYKIVIIEKWDDNGLAAKDVQVRRIEPVHDKSFRVDVRQGVPMHTALGVSPVVSVHHPDLDPSRPNRKPKSRIFAAWLRATRTARGMSQTKLAKRIRETQSMVCRLENAKAPITPALEAKIVKVLGNKGLKKTKSMAIHR